MSDTSPPLGRLTATSAGFEGQLERTYSAPPDEVWIALTDPTALAQWLAPGTIELRLGGAVRINFKDSGIVIDSAVTEFSPEALLTYSWSTPSEPLRPLRWALRPTDSGTHLTLTVTLPASDDAAKACAGFECHLDMLGAVLSGTRATFSFPRYQATREAFKAQLAG